MVGFAHVMARTMIPQAESEKARRLLISLCRRMNLFQILKLGLVNHEQR